MSYVFLVIKGFFLGLANIIPGVSGGTIAIVMGIYEKLLSVINNFFKDIKKNIMFLLPIGIGAIISIILLGKVISYSLDNYALITILFFVGLILGGIPILYKEVKGKEKVSNGLFLIVSYIIVITLSFGFTSNNQGVNFLNMNFWDYIMIFLVGVVAAATMIIPGISGSMILLLLGYYEPIVEVISNLTNFNDFWYNMSILIPLGLGVVLGIWLVAKIITWLFEKFKTKTYFAIIGFVLASVVVMFGKNTNLSFDIINIVGGILLFSIGLIGSYKLSVYEKEK